MTLQSSGVITLSNLATEFTDTSPSSLSEFYKGGGKVPNSSTNAAVPTSGAISLSNFYSTSAVTSQTFTLTTGTWVATDVHPNAIADATGFKVSGGVTGNTTATFSNTTAIGSCSPTTFNGVSVLGFYKISVTIGKDNLDLVNIIFAGNQSNALFANVVYGGGLSANSTDYSGLQYNSSANQSMHSILTDPGQVTSMTTLTLNI